MTFLNWTYFQEILLPLIIIVSIVSLAWSIYPKFNRISIPFAVGLSLIIFLYFYSSTLLDVVQKTGIITGLLSPLVVYIYDTMKVRRDLLTEIEKSVRTYLKTNIGNDVNNIAALLEDIQQHQVIFRSKYHNWSNDNLVKSNFEKVNKIGVLGYLPSLRINKYFHHVDNYNKLIFTINNSNIDKSERLVIIQSVLDINKTFSKLNEILYVNLLYNIDRLQNTIMTFPTINFPTRFNTPYLWLLLESGVLGKVREESGLKERHRKICSFDSPLKTYHKRENAYELIKVMKREGIDIYSESNAYKFVSYIGKQFESTNSELEDKFNQIIIKY